MPELNHPTKPKRVTFFEDRAEIIRTVQFSLESGRSWVSLSGVTPFVDERSIQARVIEGQAKILSVRIHRELLQKNTLSPREVQRLEEEARQKLKEQSAKSRALERASMRLQRSEETFVLWANDLKRTYNTSPQYETDFQTLQQELQQAAEETTQAQKELISAQEDALRAQERLTEGNRQEPRVEVSLSIELESQTEQNISLDVTYRTPCALWRPEHLARLTIEPDERKRGEIEIITYATAWQLTGEPWEDILVSFSTARPARQASSPLLQDDVLSLRKKTDDERRNIYVEAREQSIAVAGIERGARAQDEMPGVDDGGAPLHYSPATKVSISSNGKPFRVEIARVRVPCSVSRVLFPEKAGTAHLKASATLSDSQPILAGPARLARGSGMIGRTKLNFIGAGEPFEIGFGVDDGIRVRRTQSEQRETVPVLGTQKTKYTVELYLSNLSGEIKEVEMTERIPVSEIEEVEISLLDDGGFRVDKDGFARQSYKLHPNDTKHLKLVYEIRAASKVRLPF